MSLADEIRNEIENIKELKITVGDINNHLSVLEGLTRKDNEERKKEAYQRGYDDGKNSIDMGCKGCKFESRTEMEEPCKYCSNCHTSKYTPMSKQDDSIKVGDEVEVINSGNKYIIAWIHGSLLSGFAHDGLTCRLGPKDVRKTGRHFEISPILEALKNG